MVQHDKIYLLCDFCDDPWNDVGVIALFCRFFQFFNFDILITRKRKQISKFQKILDCSGRRDLSAVRFLWRSVKRCRSYCPFLSFFPIFQLWHLITRKRKQISKFQKILDCSGWRDLSAVQFSWRSMKRCRSYCPFNMVFSYFFNFDI